MIRLPAVHPPTCRCRGECGAAHSGGRCAIPDGLPVRWHRRDAPLRWGYASEEGSAAQNRRVKRLGWTEAVEHRLEGGFCEVCRQRQQQRGKT